MDTSGTMEGTNGTKEEAKEEAKQAAEKTAEKPNGRLARRLTPADLELPASWLTAGWPPRSGDRKTT